MATLHDIARKAGVSITTVSNVIHNRKSRVSPDMVAKIRAIIKEENYVPSMTARTLARNVSPIIGVINHLAFRQGDEFSADPFSNTFIGSIENSTRDKGYFVMVRTVEDANALEIVQRNWKLAGIILAGLYHDDFFEKVKNLGIPYVLIDSYIDLPDVLNVGLEDQKGGYLATRHLIENGHRVIAFASPTIRKDGVDERRFMGYKQALLEYGIPFDEKLVYGQEFSVEAGMNLGHKLAKMDKITAIFATADILATGIIVGLREKGINVPKDKSIVGFDNNYLCRISHPQLTTIHQDIEEKGTIATKMMLNQLMGREITERKIILPVHLVERESVANIKNI
ncbi:MAG: LacI family transcriptional regulator [Lachnospiraceae bacterium]|nr:LacI family transcriptional regulator [Lachnospiraceae bacterium]